MIIGHCILLAASYHCLPTARAHQEQRRGVEGSGLPPFPTANSRVFHGYQQTSVFCDTTCHGKNGLSCFFFFNRPKQGLSEIKATIDVQLKIVDHSEDMAVSPMLVIDTLNFGVTTRTLW